MSDSTYNGWTNWETWNFKLWLDNDESTYRAVCELAEGSKIMELEWELESWANDMMEEIGLVSGFFADACNTAIKRINFYEIAESYLKYDVDGEVE